MSTRRWWVAVSLGLLAATLVSGCRRKTASTVEQAEAVAPEKALIVSEKTSRLYHFCTCPYAKDVPAKDLIGFSGPEAAERSGRIPCSVCNPRESFRERVMETRPAGAETRVGGPAGEQVDLAPLRP
jgi:hypothetical protein